MKLAQLLNQRAALLRQAQLANLAYAYGQMRQLVTRIETAGLRGPVCLEPADPEEERYWPTLRALAGSQAVIDEHFTENELLELGDLVVFLSGDVEQATTFRLEDMGARFLAPLQHKLELAGVEFDSAGPRAAEPAPRMPHRN